ncbi:MAG: beta-propeller fold lactonase family protein, partial [Candidatus Korobacteraceae bacterium]
IAALSLCMTGCGYNYRPIVDTVPKPGGDPDPSRTALVINTSGVTTQINVSGDSNMGNFAVGDGPVHATFLFGQTLAFVANRDEDNVAFYNPTQAASQVQRINLPVGSRPVFVHTTESSTQGNCQASSISNVACVYVACSGSNSVAVLSVGQALMQGDPIPVGNNPVALVQTPDRAKLYVVNRDDASVSVITTSTMQNTTTIDVGADPVWAVMHSDGTRLYVVNQGSGTVSVINTATDTVVAQLPVGASPRHAFYDEALRRLWVVNGGSNTVSVFDVDAGASQLLATIPVGTAPVAIVALADGTRAYVANSGSNTVSVISSLGLTVSKTISLGNGSAPANPSWIAASPDSSKVFVANRGANSVASIRTSSDQIITEVPSAGSPIFIAVSP